MVQISAFLKILIQLTSKKKEVGRLAILQRERDHRDIGDRQYIRNFSLHSRTNEANERVRFVRNENANSHFLELWSKL